MPFAVFRSGSGVSDGPCPTLGQLLASRILYALLVGEKQHEIARARFCTQSCSKVGQLLTNSWNGVVGRGCDEAEISEEKRLFTEWVPGIQ